MIVRIRSQLGVSDSAPDRRVVGVLLTLPRQHHQPLTPADSKPTPNKPSTEATAATAMRALLPRENGASCASGDAPLNAAPSPPRVGQPGGIVPSPPASQDELKKAAAWKAAELVEDGMVLGLGTGSTVAFAVERVAQLLREGALRDVVGIATSAGTLEQAKGGFVDPRAGGA